jgi:hypothetical protein
MLQYRSLGRRQSLAAAALGGAALAASPVCAADTRSPIVGSWRLTSFSMTDQETNVTTTPYGEKPGGMMTYTPGGRYVVFLAGEGRPAPAASVPTQAEKADLFGSIIAAYSGTYRVEGDQMTIRVDTAWTPAWNGTELRRTFAIEGDRLSLRTNALLNVSTGRKIVGNLTLVRVE